MATLEVVAGAVLGGDAFRARSLAQDWLASRPVFDREPPPGSRDPRVLAVAAGLVELFAARAGQPPPAWAAEVGPSPEPLYLVRGALAMRRLRESCERESPPPLRRRRLYAPANFLSFV